MELRSMGFVSEVLVGSMTIGPGFSPYLALSASAVRQRLRSRYVPKSTKPARSKQADYST